MARRSDSEVQLIRQAKENLGDRSKIAEICPSTGRGVTASTRASAVWRVMIVTDNGITDDPLAGRRIMAAHRKP
ncbi:MAG TPA: hypothetical protein DDZ84_03840 [Firmicutes bacterium]|nr:hypothetical protein [Bacillota bacterium]